MNDERDLNNERVIRAFLYGCLTIIYFAGAIIHVKAVPHGDFELILILFGGFTWLIRIVELLEVC